MKKKVLGQAPSVRKASFPIDRVRFKIHSEGTLYAQVDTSNALGIANIFSHPLFKA